MVKEADFEGASAHEALEEADHDAYESFEGGLSGCRTGISEARIDEYLGPIEATLDAGMTPSDWKSRVREYLHDGDDLSTASQ